jgi:hypothetical protein
MAKSKRKHIKRPAAAPPAAPDAPTTLEVIEEFARLMFGPADVAIGAEVDESQIRDDPPSRAAYNRGRLAAQARVRKMILTMAESGSAPAQKMVLDLAKANKLEEVAGPPAVDADAASARAHLTGGVYLPGANDESSLAELARLAVLRIVELEGLAAPRPAVVRAKATQHRSDPSNPSDPAMGPQGPTDSAKDPEADHAR